MINIRENMVQPKTQRPQTPFISLVDSLEDALKLSSEALELAVAIGIKLRGPNIAESSQSGDKQPRKPESFLEVSTSLVGETRNRLSDAIRELHAINELI